jgi:hypothetical protein
MANIALYDFIGTNRDELIRRCRVKVATRSAPQPTEAEINHGVPLFLEQLSEELRQGPSKADAINQSAMEHGHDLLLQGFTISQVVHDYGDVCQSITDLAVETNAPISADDFRTLNRCLDDAIAGAVSEYTHEQGVSRLGATDQILRLTETALTAFEVLRTGRVGVGGSTGTVVLHSLMGIREALVERPLRRPPTAAQAAKGLGPVRSQS